MSPGDDLHRQLRLLLLAYERLDMSWRKQFSLNANEKLAILYLVEGVASPTDLADVIGLTTAGMTNLLDRLEDKGFVLRHKHPNDGRRVLVSLTKRAIQARLEFEQATSEMADASSDADREVIAAFLERAAAIATERSREEDGSRFVPRGADLVEPLEPHAEER